MQGTIQPDIIPTNKFEFKVVGLITIVVTQFSGIEEELETVELPDRQIVSTGNTKSIEFTITTPAHHVAEQVAMEGWFAAAQGVQATAYRYPATLTMKSGTEQIFRQFSFSDCFPKMRATPDLNMADEGEMASIVWTMVASKMLPV